MKNLQSLHGRLACIALIFYVVLFAFIASTFTPTASAHAGAISVQAQLTGEWTAQLGKGDKQYVEISVSRRSAKGDVNNMTGESVLLSEFRGLSTQAVTSAKTDVNFSLVREAGTIVFEGYFREGRGTGFWTFTPNQAFAAALKGRYGYLNDDEMLRATLNNLTAKYIDEIKAAGYGDLDFNQLVRAAGHEITPGYISSLKSAGFSNLTMDQLIRASNHEINGAYVAEVKAMGFEKQDLDTVIRMKNHEISPAYVGQMKAIGFPTLSIDDLIRLKNHDVTPEFVNEIKAEGFSSIDADMAIRLKNRDINADFIRRAKAQGYSNASLDEIIRLSGKGAIK